MGVTTGVSWVAAFGAGWFPQHIAISPTTAIINIAIMLFNLGSTSV